MLRMASNRIKNLALSLTYLSSQSQSHPTKSKFVITGKKAINHDCYIYNVSWAGPKFPMTIGQHFRIVQTIPTSEHPEGEEVIRKYTPISPCSQEDNIELLIKVYRPGTSLQFPLGGKLTPYLQKLKVGDHINIDGPFGKFSYKKGGVVVVNGKEMAKKRIFFMAGGSGITPCFQTIREITNMPDEKIELILLYANKTQADIVLRKQIQELQPRLQIFYCLDTAPEKWNHFSGYATKQMLQKVCPLDDPDTLYIHCGPGAMNSSIRKMFATYFPNSTLFKY